MLRRASQRFDFHTQIGSVLDEAAGQLLNLAGEGEIATDDIAAALRPTVDRLAKQYTMAQEREVHRALTEGLGDGAGEVEAEVAVVEDDDLLF
jgi:hypothetical protein